MGIETAIGAGIGLLSGSKKSGSSTSTQSNAPWAVAQPYWETVFQRAHAVPYQNNPNLSSPAASQLGATIRGDFLNPSSNPFFTGAVNDALGLAKSQFAGQYGGQAGGNLGNSGYQEMLMRTLGNLSTNAFADQYSRERQNQLAASSAAPQFDASAMASPFAPLREYASILAGSPGGQSTTSQPIYTNPLAGALGGALAGSQIGGMMNQAPLVQGMVPGQYSMFNPQYG